MMDTIDPGARAGRTGYRLNVKEAKRHVQGARHMLGTSREDTPTVLDILAAATHLSNLLRDATEGDAIIVVAHKDAGEVTYHSPAAFRRGVSA